MARSTRTSIKPAPKADPEPSFSPLTVLLGLIFTFSAFSAAYVSYRHVLPSITSPSRATALYTSIQETRPKLRMPDPNNPQAIYPEVRFGPATPGSKSTADAPPSSTADAPPSTEDRPDANRRDVAGASSNERIAALLAAGRTRGMEETPASPKTEEMLLPPVPSPANEEPPLAAPVDEGPKIESLEELENRIANLDNTVYVFFIAAGPRGFMGLGPMPLFRQYAALRNAIHSILRTPFANKTVLVVPHVATEKGNYEKLALLGHFWKWTSKKLRVMDLNQFTARKDLAGVLRSAKIYADTTISSETAISSFYRPLLLEAAATPENPLPDPVASNFGPAGIRCDSALGRFERAFQRCVADSICEAVLLPDLYSGDTNCSETGGEYGVGLMDSEALLLESGMGPGFEMVIEKVRQGGKLAGAVVALQLSFGSNGIAGTALYRKQFGNWNDLLLPESFSATKFAQRTARLYACMRQTREWDEIKTVYLSGPVSIVEQIRSALELEGMKVLTLADVTRPEDLDSLVSLGMSIEYVRAFIDYIISADIVQFFHGSHSSILTTITADRRLVRARRSGKFEDPLMYYPAALPYYGPEYSGAPISQCTTGVYEIQT